MRERGQIVKKGTLSEDGNVEFWEDGTTTPSTYKRSDRTTGQEDTEKLDEDPAMTGR
jgi:protein import protein ZIM17